MREISKIFIIKSTDEEVHNLIKKAADNGMEYPPFHYLVRVKDQEFNLQTIKKRPLCLNNGLTRMSNISATSIGVIIVENKELFDFNEPNEALYKKIGIFIASLMKDFCIDASDINNYITSFDSNNRVDINKIFHYTNEMLNAVFKKINQ